MTTIDRITTPNAPKPAGHYSQACGYDDLVFVSGQLPMKDGKPQSIGKLGKDFTVEQGQETAKLCGLNLLAQLRAACGGNLDRVKRCVRLGIFVQSSDGFSDQPKVANGVSDLMVQIFGDAGKHVRSAFGVVQILFGACVEIELIAEVA